MADPRDNSNHQSRSLKKHDRDGISYGVESCTVQGERGLQRKPQEVQMTASQRGHKSK